MIRHENGDGRRGICSRTNAREAYSVIVLDPVRSSRGVGKSIICKRTRDKIGKPGNMTEVRADVSPELEIIVAALSSR